VQLEVNAVGRVIRELDRREGMPGQDVQISVDAELQKTLRGRIEEGTSIVVLDARNGEVLAMASQPSFDPAVFNSGVSAAQWREWTRNRATPLINKATNGLYAPGSTFKMIVALAGLEAKVVIIADIGAAPSSRANEPFLDIPLKSRAPGTGPAVATVWSPRKGDDAAAAAEARSQRDAGQRAEFLRLLYVAMTRAEDRLIVCGIRPANGKLPAGSWYGLIESGLSATPAGLVEAPRAAGGLAVRRFKVTPEIGPRLPAMPVAAPDVAVPALPDWVHASVPDEVEAAPPLAPANALSAAGAGARSADQAAQGSLLAEAAARGRAVHRLLQWLPRIEPEVRHGVGLRLLGKDAGLAGASGHAGLVAQARGLIEAHDLAALFGAGSLAEVEIAGSIETAQGRRDVSGRIDRLVVTATDIILADFKTTLRPPESAWQIGAATLAQLAAYRQLLRQLYPDRPIRTWVIYTAGPRVLAPHDAQLDQALADGFGVKVTEP
jgi:ATP-dependent helicase/nuclease subunit A